MQVNLVKFWSVICDGLYEVILYLGGEGEVREGVRGENVLKIYCVIKLFNCYKVWDYMYSTVQLYWLGVNWFSLDVLK